MSNYQDRYTISRNEFQKQASPQELYIKELQEKVQAYEAMLERGLRKPRKVGVVQTDEVDGVYRILSEGQTFFLPIGQDNAEEDIIVNKNDTVWFTEDFIVGVLPKNLHISKEPPSFEKVKWEDIGGIASQIEEIRDSIEKPITHESLYREFGVDPIKGVALYGPPGCGKTMIAKAIATVILSDLKKVMNNSFVYMNIGDTMSKFYGETENRIRDIFKNARLHYKETGVRAVIFVDEAEALLPTRGSKMSSDVESTTVPTFLEEMDGIETGSPFVILATNKIEAIDPAVLREGRIDLKIKINRPTLNDSVDIFNIYLKKINKKLLIGGANELSTIAANALFTYDAKANVSGSMIATIVKTATKNAINRIIKNSSEKRGITPDDLNAAINQITKPYAKQNF